MQVQRQPNNKNDFFNTEGFLNNDKDRFLWLGNYEQLKILINCIPFCQSSGELINFISFSNNDFIFETNETIVLFENLKKIDYNQLVISVIFNYLQINYKQKNMSLDYAEWVDIIPILVKTETSNSVLTLLNELHVMEFLIKTKTKSQFKIAVLLFFNTFFNTKPAFSSYSYDFQGITNLLTFLKVDKSLIKTLIEKSLCQQNFNDLTQFLMKYNFDDSIHSA